MLNNEFARFFFREKIVGNVITKEIDYHWQCRRGMLELDLLLNNFVDKKIEGLTPKQKASFELLLSYPDQTLLDLLLGNSVSSDILLSALIKEIQSTSFT
jgi:antitoxin CptB